MQGKTHLVTGTALALFLLCPSERGALVAGAGVAAIGSVISDIDEDHSKSHSGTVKTGAVLIGIICILILLDRVLKLDLLGYVRSMEAMSSPGSVALICLVLLICFGILSPHRSFMHSFIGMVLTGLCVRGLLPELYVYYLIGFASHLLLDFFNKKGEMLFYPLRARFCIGICRAGGFVDSVLFTAGFAALTIVVYRLVTGR